MFSLGDHNLATCFLLKMHCILQALSLKSGQVLPSQQGCGNWHHWFWRTKTSPQTRHQLRISWFILLSLLFLFNFKEGYWFCLGHLCRKKSGEDAQENHKGQQNGSGDFSNPALCFPTFPAPKSYRGPALLLSPSLITHVRSCFYTADQQMFCHH